MRVDEVRRVVTRTSGEDVVVRQVHVDHPERLVLEADLGIRRVVIKATAPDTSMPGGDLAKEIRAVDAARAAAARTTGCCATAVSWRRSTSATRGSATRRTTWPR
ncbi:MAG: hypothetical protein ACRDP6_18225, partial [Actinoallomurus sp.]